MALDVYIQPGPELPPNRNIAEHVVSIEGGGRGQNGGYFWFLFPLFNDLPKRTGQRIDLYGNAAFWGEMLDALEETLTHAHSLVDAQPDTWQVRTGIQINPVRREVYEIISKQQINVLLGKLDGAVRQAKATGVCVIFFGD